MNDDYLQKGDIFAICVDNEITKEDAMKIYETKFWEKLVWSPLDISYLQFKQERMVMTHETWFETTQKVLADRQLLYWFFHSPNVRAEIIDRYEMVNLSDKLYNVHITHVDSGDTEFTRDDFRYAEGYYFSQSDSEPSLGFYEKIMKIAGSWAEPGMLGGSREFATNWKVRLKGECYIYYTIYLDESYYDLMRNA